MMELKTNNSGETQTIGRALGELAQPGDVFLLSGELGSGKTCLTQGIAWGLGISDHARSPTFVLITEYEGRLTLYHADLYRLSSIEELYDLGVDEYLEEGFGVLVVEWANRIPEAFPGDHLAVQIETTGLMERRLLMVPSGSRYEILLKDLERLL